MLHSENPPSLCQFLESIYGLARNEIYGRASHSRAWGSSGVAAAKAVTKYGVIYRDNYSDKYGYDLTTYTGDRAYDFGANGSGGAKDGIDGPFDQYAKKHPIQTAALVRTSEEAKIALKNGYPIGVCSGQGFTSVRDKQGACSPSGSWSHCMAILAYKNDNGRELFLIQNSWGGPGQGGCSGPKGTPDDIPDGSFWADSSVVGRMLSGGDSFAVSGETGFPAQKLDFRLHWDGK